jgi:glycogen debranching enzyme
MAFKVHVGPPQITVHQGQTVLVSEHDGRIKWPSDKGLYFRDTRMISSWTIYANGEEWELLTGGPISYFAARIVLTNNLIRTEDGAIPPRTLGLTISRSVSGGVHEDLDITNNSMSPVRFQLELAIRSDFADIFEVKSGQIIRRGQITTEWSQSQQRLCTAYAHGDFKRAVTASVSGASSNAVYANGRLSFQVALEPAQSWHACLLYTLEDGEERFEAPDECIWQASKSHDAATTAEWLHAVAKIETTNEEFYRLFRQALEDMAALRLPIKGTDHVAFLPAAGVPWFVAPFGRDSLIVSLQNMLIYPHFARGALDILGSLQAKEDDPYRDAEPGKILHELRYGELAHFKQIPHTPYYGTADATPLYLITLHSAWRATGDEKLLERHLQTAEACLSWIDKYGDRDGDGFQEYQSRSPVGYENMSWKDAGDAVMNADGSPVKAPKALCELQAYVYSAWLRMAEVFDVLDRTAQARELRVKAARLFEQFNETFWEEEFGFYAYALDGDKRKVLTVASNPGHCLAAGIVPPERAKRVVDRLMAPDMWTGWGIRTLSAKHPAFNPYSYQNGSVWPHDNAIIALGFKHYGFAAEAAQIAHDISKAASHFLLNQLPELYTAFERNNSNFPVQYIGANVPQAWAAGSAFMLTQALLGFLPDAPHDKLYVDPWLPAWLPDLTIRDLRIGRHKLDIRFWRDDDNTKFQVLNGDADVVERCELKSKIAWLRTSHENSPSHRGGRRAGVLAGSRRAWWRSRLQSDQHGR